MFADDLLVLGDSWEGGGQDHQSGEGMGGQPQHARQHGQVRHHTVQPPRTSL